MDVWGKELMVNCRSCDRELIADETILGAFAIALCDAIKMERHGSPQLVHFGHDDKQGYTLVQLISTSNISGHFCDATGDAYINVFSCKDFDPLIVERIVKQFFKPLAMECCYVERDARKPIHVIETWSCSFES